MMLPAEREMSLDAVIEVWWLRQYAGGLFLPLRDGTAGQSSYGGQAAYHEISDRVSAAPGWSV